MVAAIAIFAAGVAAYQGRWHSWPRSTFFGWEYAPLGGTWLALAAVLVDLGILISIFLPNTPGFVSAVTFILALVSALFGLLYIHPPRFLLPAWVRWVNGDASVATRPACLDLYEHSKVDSFMRIVTLDFLNDVNR
jgi:hypothetical protein